MEISKKLSVWISYLLKSVYLSARLFRTTIKSLDSKMVLNY